MSKIIPPNKTRVEFKYAKWNLTFQFTFVILVVTVQPSAAVYRQEKSQITITDIVNGDADITKDISFSWNSVMSSNILTWMSK